MPDIGSLNATSKQVIRSLTTGTQTIMVGVNGQYTTIQAAIDAISSNSFFTDITNDARVLGLLPDTSTAWTQGSSNVTAQNAAGNAFDIPDTWWFKITGDTTDPYPLQSLKGLNNILYSGMNRVEASFAGSAALSYFEEVLYTIELLDPLYAETVTINFPCCIRFIGNNSLWRGVSSTTAFIKGASFTYGRLDFGSGLICQSDAIASWMIPAQGWSTANRIKVAFTPGSKINNLLGDFISGNGMSLGSLRVYGCEMNWNNFISSGHFFGINGSIPGDVIAIGNTLKVENQYTNTNPDASLFSGCESRQVIVSGLNAHLSDLPGKLNTFAIVDGARCTPNTLISDVHITIKDASQSNATISIVDQYSSLGADVGSTNMVSFDNCTINAPNFLGTIRHFKDAGTAVLKATVKLQRCGAAIVDKPTTTVITYLDNPYIQVPAFSATPTPDANMGKKYMMVALTAATAIGAPANPQKGQELEFVFTENGTGGFNVTWAAAFHFMTAWSNTGNTANTRSEAKFIYDGSAWYQTSPANAWIA
jgi:hypothetical protein